MATSFAAQNSGGLQYPYTLLNTVCAVRGGAAHPRFMTEKGAQDVILALRTMMLKAGFNPDGLTAATR